MAGEIRSTWQCGPACLCAQILHEGAECYTAQGASCFSAEYAWRQLMPDLAVLVRSLCVAAEAWPPEVPKPAGFTRPRGLHAPLGLQSTVRAWLPIACMQSAYPMLAPCAEAVITRLVTEHGGPTALSQALPLQHMRIHVALYAWAATPVAAEAERSAFVEAMCGEATSDLLCWSLEKGLGQGDPQAEHVHGMHTEC